MGYSASADNPYLEKGVYHSFQDGPVAQWIRHLTTNQGIPGSNPGGVEYFY